MDKNEINIFNYVMEYLDPEVSNILIKIPNIEKEVAEEIRLRNGRPLMIYAKGKDFYINKTGKLSELSADGFIIRSEHINRTFKLISNYSVYAFEEEIKNGFITLKGGHRVGISGKTVYGKNGLETIKNISSLNIRIAKEKLGVSDKVIKYLINYPSSIYNTLIVSPPQCGKTTLLRDIIRNISDGIPSYKFFGLKVGVVDERSEIAGMYNGVPQNSIGNRTDILDGCLKHDGIRMLIRSMSPQVIATDELGSYEDIQAIHEALKAGVNILATVHGEDLKDITSNEAMKKIIEEKIFKRIIILDNSKGVGTIRDVIDGNSFSSIMYWEEGLYGCFKVNW